ncbi:50S ribosomal protein L19 [bacterium]|jgi:large subunit ribosomal protein L19|nr:50S ribosomal protein L19 [bacterium]MBT5015167.1 50S ribosomal protein L19 [bacterium]
MKAKGYTKETILDIGIEKRNFPRFEIGDSVAVSLRVKEGNKERIQIFQGDVIAIQKTGIATTFTVRKIGANSVAVEKIFPFYSPVITDIKVVRYGTVRRAKIYYVRDKVGKAARVKEKVLTRDQKEAKKDQIMFEKPSARTTSETAK